MTKLNTDLETTWVLIDSLEPNPWNPNEQTEFIYEKTKESILQRGFKDTIKVRQLDNGKLQIVDGEHRWKVAQDLAPLIKLRGKRYFIVMPPDPDIEDGEERLYPANKKWADGLVPVTNYGEMSEAIARELTIILNNTRGEPDTLKLAEVIKELDELVGSDERESLLPFTADEQQSMMDLLDFDWKQFQSSADPDPDPEPQEEWEPYLFSIPPDAKGAIDDEIKRIGKILKVNPRLPKEMRWGLILEKICILSAQTPTESLE